MQTFIAAAIQMVSTPDVVGNLKTAERLIAQAAASGAQLLVLPEYFAIMGQRDSDKLAVKEAFGGGPIQDFLAAQAARHQVWLVGGTIPLVGDDAIRVRNACLAYDPHGRCVARYDKIHLFGFDNGEERYAEADTIEPGGEVTVFDTPFGRVGLAVCYDLRFPELFRREAVDVWVLPAAFTATTGRAHWEVLLRARAIENQCFVVAAAQGGLHVTGRETFGHSEIVDPWGQVLACLPTGEGVAQAELKSSQLDRVRRILPALRHRRLG
ncbi:carbon-nitrogen hydrolase family protein [Chitiniphilus eburneus]|uniref:Carbon-nitrogen hydrolase family protein n=1 Tax=Chitiniphilus eburneus TaxID=2571148 RepID=A0A4U0Q649_9NEIS|nr:carbon-nitrogen hydrolase family protein [Chitiniphilus eburneus]TJZ75672.1 carbon-nitrogen hydrolase family protein [Chitiniphilus eburneus]